MKKFSASIIKYTAIFFLLLNLSQPAFSQQNADTNFYLLKKDWTHAKNIKEATYFMQLTHENDTMYSCRYYYKSGGMIRQETFLDSTFAIPNGRFCWYDINGMLDSTGLVYRGKKTGVWKYYNDNADLILASTYKDGHFFEKRDYLKNEYTDSSRNTIDLLVKEKAEHDAFIIDSLAGNTPFRKAVFEEQDTAKRWKEFLSKNIVLPERFTNIYIIGSCSVTVSFTINSDGKTDDIYLTRSCEWSADNEVFNAIRKRPSWTITGKGDGSMDNSLLETVTFHADAKWSKDSAHRSGVYIGSQVPAKFPGDKNAWQQFLSQNLNNDVPLNHGAPAGQYLVVVSFLIQKDGSVSEIKAEQDPGYGAAQELMRVLKKSPKWMPAMQDGVPVIYRQKQAITFFVSQN